ncbi:MAG: Gfo/Idh/MocA family protein [Pirellulaceae bacterium]
MSLSTRRTFLQVASTSLASATALSPLAVSHSFAGAPSDKVRVGVIGCGGRGKHDAGLFQSSPNVEIAYVCDCDKSRLAETAKQFNVPAKGVISDMRKMLDDKSLDAVIITTPDHWHSPAAILACEAGKHVYVEKPISHNIREGRLLIEAAAKNKVQVQHGTQSRSTQMMIEAVKLLRDGIIGPVLVAKCWNIQKRGTIGRGQDTPPPAGFDYDSWVGPATMIPYRTNRVHNRWTWWYHFGTGDMGNDGVHDIDYTRWGLGVETHPSKIVALGGKYFQDDDQEFPDTQQVAFEYPGDGKPGSRRMLIYEQRLWDTVYPHNVDSGAEFHGPGGQMFLSRRGKIQVLDSQNKPKPVEITPQQQDDKAHVANLLAAIRSGVKLNADPLIGHLSTCLCHLGNIATRLGRSLNFDPAKEQILGDEEASRLVRRDYRDHWGRPKGA